MITPTPPRHRSRRALAAVLAATIVLGGCSSDDDTNDGAATTTVGAELPELTLTVSPEEWGPLASCEMGPQSGAESGTPADEGIDGVLAFEVIQGHVEDCVDYPVHPPTGGQHFPAWANCGFYTSPVPEQTAVHVLEHGGVWIAFDPTIGDDAVATIRAAADASTHVLANPYPGLTSKVVMGAWGRQLSLDSAADPRFQEFLDQYVQGPETPELGASCSGALGDPQPKG